MHPWNSPKQITKLFLPLVFLFFNRYACILLWSQWKLTLISSTAWDTGIRFMAASRRSCSTSTWVCCSTDGICRGIRFEEVRMNLSIFACRMVLATIFLPHQTFVHIVMLTLLQVFNTNSTPTIRVPSQCSSLINSPSPSSPLPLWVSYL